MLTFNVEYQEKYSATEAFLRALFGPFYIGLPHIFALMFISIWVSLCMFYAWFVVLFTGKYPKDVFDLVVGYYRWSARLNNSLMGLSDGYPAFSLKHVESDKFVFEVEYTEERSRLQLLLLTFFGAFYVLIPHYFVLAFFSIWVSILSWVAFWSVVFTSKFPKDWHTTIVNFYRWYYRVDLYYLLISSKNYPPFSGKPE